MRDGLFQYVEVAGYEIERCIAKVTIKKEADTCMSTVVFLVGKLWLSDNVYMIDRVISAYIPYVVIT